MNFDKARLSGVGCFFIAFLAILSCGASAADKALEAVRAKDIPAASGSVSLPDATAAKTEPATLEPAWTNGSFKSSIGKTDIAYKFRMTPGAKETTVFAGGLALAESFDSLFQYAKPGTNQFFLWFRGLPPSQWAPGRAFFDADARDLARFINFAAEKAGVCTVNLVLHSYSTLVVQKMIQLRGDIEVDMALSHLRGSQVLMLNATTHYKGSEALADPEYAKTAKVISDFIKWLNMMDDFAAGWQDAAAHNPALQIPVTANLAVWELQREGALKMASDQARKMMVDHLSVPWAYDPAGVRTALLATVRRNIDIPSWQEALLRRTDDTAKLDFTPHDVEAIRAAGIKLDFLHSTNDQLIPWKAERLTVELFGIGAPEQMPQPGSVFRDRSGLFSLQVVVGDHYFPLKEPGALAQFIRK